MSNQIFDYPPDTTDRYIEVDPSQSPLEAYMQEALSDDANGSIARYWMKAEDLYTSDVFCMDERRDPILLAGVLRVAQYDEGWDLRPESPSYRPAAELMIYALMGATHALEDLAFRQLHDFENVREYVYDRSLGRQPWSEKQYRDYYLERATRNRQAAIRIYESLVSD